MTAGDIYDGQGEDDPERRKDSGELAERVSIQCEEINGLIDQILKRGYNLIPVLKGHSCKLGEITE